MRSAVEIKKKPSLNRAFVALVQLLSEEQRKSVISDELFSNCISSLESSLLKKYCLLNYFDPNEQDKINDYVVSFDHLKSSEKVEDVNEAGLKSKKTLNS